jgi:hypothetical protein
MPSSLLFDITKHPPLGEVWRKLSCELEKTSRRQLIASATLF